MSRYIIVGAGAVGATIGAQLHLAGIDTLLVARGAHLAALRDHGLRYRRPDGEHRLRIPVAAGATEVEARADDVLVLATKSQDTAPALAEWAGAEPRAVLTLQNGLDNERQALRYFATVLGAAVWAPSSYLVPGEVIAPAALPAALWLGRYPSGDAPQTAPIAADLRRAGIAVQIVPDVVRWKAGKLLANMVNGLDALYPPSERRDALQAALRQETLDVLTAAGIDPADQKTESTLDLSGLATRESGHSTWQSLTRGVPPETDYLNGEIVLLARLHGVPAPLNAAIQRSVRHLVAEGAPPRSLDIDQVRF
jgi:2-dehydropantoate 2-reductase